MHKVHKVNSLRIHKVGSFALLLTFDIRWTALSRRFITSRRSTQSDCLLARQVDALFTTENGTPIDIHTRSKIASMSKNFAYLTRQLENAADEEQAHKSKHYNFGAGCLLGNC